MLAIDRRSLKPILVAAACAAALTAPASADAAIKCKPIGATPSPGHSVAAPPANLVAAHTGCTTARRVSRTCLDTSYCTTLSARRTIRVRGLHWRCATSHLPNAGGSRTSCYRGPRVVRFDLLNFSGD